MGARRARSLRIGTRSRQPAKLSHSLHSCTRPTRRFLHVARALPLAPQARAALTKPSPTKTATRSSSSLSSRCGASASTLPRAAQIASFPAHDVTKTDAWSRAPRTRVLPDRFVLLLYPTRDLGAARDPGALIPDTVFLGPDPLDPQVFWSSKDGARMPGGDSAWLSDFDLAVAQGLGFRVPLSEQEAAAGFARVAVLGLRLSAGAQDGAAMLEELITNHQYAPSGFSLVPQGTPTNNTERTAPATRTTILTTTWRSSPSSTRRRSILPRPIR